MRSLLFDEGRLYSSLLPKPSFLMMAFLQVSPRLFAVPSDTRIGVFALLSRPSLPRGSVPAWRRTGWRSIDPPSHLLILNTSPALLARSSKRSLPTDVKLLLFFLKEQRSAPPRLFPPGFSLRHLPDSSPPSRNIDFYGVSFSIGSPIPSLSRAKRLIPPTLSLN